MRYQRILCPIDFSEHAHAALSTAVEIARADEAGLTLIHAYRRPSYGYGDLSGPFPPELIGRLQKDAETGLASWKTDAEKLGARRVATIAIEGEAWNEIVAAAERERIDLVVMGTHGRTGIRRVLLGSVAERVTRHAPCSVLVVR